MDTITDEPAVEVAPPESATIVSNQFPSKPSTRRIAVIGEFSDANDLKADKPFMGAAGSLLTKFLAQVGIDRDACFLGNVCQHKPPGNIISKFKWDGPEMVAGRAHLELDLLNYQPDICILLGNTPLRAFAGEPRTIGNWRGSVFQAAAMLPGVKCIATYHPSAVLRDYALTGVCRFDYQRAAREACTDWTPPPADKIVLYTPTEGINDLDIMAVMLRLSLIKQRKQTVAIDIEGWCTGITCIGFATSANDAFVVPFSRQDGTSYWDEDTEVRLWEAVQSVLEDPAVTKVCHNALYELFCLGWYDIAIRGHIEDTMLLSHELHAELEKSLGFIASLYTPHPYWKGERKTADDRVALLYNGKDCCRTYECWQAMLPKLKPKQLEHYRTNLACLIPTAYQTLRGLAFNKAEARLRYKANQRLIHEKQDAINQTAVSTRPDLAALYTALNSIQYEGAGVVDTQALVALLASAFCRARCTEQREVEETKWQPVRWQETKGKWIKAGKRCDKLPEGAVSGAIDFPFVDGDIAYQPITKIVTRNIPVEIKTLADVRRFAKDSCKRHARRACAIVKLLRHAHQPVGSMLPDALRGELATLLGCHINLSSTGNDGDAAWLLYTCWGLPKQYKKEGNKFTTTLDTGAGGALAAWVAAGAKDERCLHYLELKGLIKQQTYLRTSGDEDGRLRYSLNLVATPTGRMACYESPTGSSTLNMQTIGKKLRDLFSTDGTLIQTDLDGSDSWTVAAYCASLGDRTMLDDLEARIKCAKVLVLIYTRGNAINALPREELRKLMKDVDSEDWKYPAMKGCNHGSCYLMQGAGVSKKILKDSYKLTGTPVYVSPATCTDMQRRAFFVRYAGVEQWHGWMKRELVSAGSLTAFNGFTRKFYGRKKDGGTQRTALSHMPQVITTYAIKLALLSMWHDPENRRPDGTLRVEPLLMVHDSLIKGVRDAADIDFCKSAVKRWFNHEMNVNGIKFVIPANSTGGPDWLHQGAEKYSNEGGFDL